MQRIISPIIQPHNLLSLKSTHDIVLVDARAGAKEKYAEKHLKGALFVDLETQLADIQANAAQGGRHPLPTVHRFTQVLEQLGISPDSRVVVYDDKNGANAAARFWWMLKSVGHPFVQVLDGGMAAAIKAGFPTDSGMEQPHSQGKYQADNWIFPLSNLDEVIKATADKEFLIIDVRDKYRYDGVSEPIDLIAGHIPNAINIPFSENLDSYGFFLPPSELKNKYEKALAHKKLENVMVHCGSGVTACHTLLAMDYAGLDIPKLYVGSWSEWSRNKLPIATELENKDIV